MPLSTLRWRLSKAIRGALFSTRSGHPLRVTYRVVRRIPGVHTIWRVIDPIKPVDNDKWGNAAKYLKNGGMFGPSAPGAPAKLPPVVEFDHADFFQNLVTRILAAEPRPEAADGPIVLVNNGLSAGGAERQIVATLCGLKRRGEDVLFIGEYLDTAPGHDFHLHTLEDAGVPYRSLERVTEPGPQQWTPVSRETAEQLWRAPMHLQFEILDMVRMLRAVRPKLVHLWQDETSIKIGIAALIAGVPKIVLSGRNVNPTNFVYHQEWMRPAYRALLSVPAVIPSNNSHAGARSYAEWLGVDPARVQVVHNGIETSAWPNHSKTVRDQLRTSLAITPETPLILGVFRLAGEKRPLLWIDTAAETLTRNPKARFAIAGDGPMKRQVQQRMEKLGVAGLVKLLGERKDIANLFMAADAFLLTSAHEGVPNVLLEAQWYGVPALVTPAGGAPEALADGKTGRLAHSDSATEIAADLASILADDALRERARTEGPAFVARAFGLERMIDETLDLYGLPRPASAARAPETQTP